MSKPSEKSSGFSRTKYKKTGKQQKVKESADHGSKEQQALALINQSRLEDAEAIYRELIAAGSTNHTIYGNLAAICGMQGRFEELIELLEKSLEIKPDYPAAHYNLGNAYKAQGDLTSAMACYEKALSLNPNHPETHNNIGIIFKEQGDLSAAIASFSQAISLDPSDSEAHYNLGNVLKEQGNLSAAISSFNQSLSLNPSHPDTHNNLGTVLKEQGDLTAAVSCFNQAIALNPDNPEAYYNLGNAQKVQGYLTSAISSFTKALTLNQNLPDAHNNLGNTLQEKGDVSAAIESFNQALSLNPHDPDIHKNLSMAELLKGDYRNGWERYEYRLQSREDKDILYANPLCSRWNGENISPHDSLLLVSEQGLGDTFQFMRYVITLREKGINVSLSAPKKLHSLIQESGIDLSPLSQGEANQVKFGYWAPLLSVPRHLEVSPDNPIITDPYIRTKDEIINKWGKIFSAEQRPVIGINWQGNPSHETTNSSGRSLPLEAFVTVANKTTVSLLSLQKGSGSEQLETCSFKDRFVNCQDLVNKTWDFLETAAMVINCDLVITSDTSVAHLAGGLGKKTWLLLKNVPEWRWGLEGVSTFWYPSMRLFRQKERGNWSEVMERVGEELIRSGYSSESVSSPMPPMSQEQTSPGLNYNKKKISDIKIFCISLIDARSRRQAIVEMKERLNLNLEFIDAVDGRSATREEIQVCTDRIIKWNSLGGHRDEISKPTEAACSLSHIKAWQTVVKEELKEVIILEDDSFCEINFELMIPNDAEFVYLSSRASSDPDGEATAPICGAEAYYITAQCAQKLLKINHEIRMPVDIQWLPQIKSLITSRHFITVFTSNRLPTFRAHSIPGVFKLNENHFNSQIRSGTEQQNHQIQNILAPISLGELVDKITILEIKAKIVSGNAVKNVNKELHSLKVILNNLKLTVDPALVRDLRIVNQDLWQIEDEIRDHELRNSFGNSFIDLARSVYQKNDQRAAIKRQINVAHGSNITEEKSYQKY